MEYIGRVQNGVIVLDTSNVPCEGTRVRVQEIPSAAIPSHGGAIERAFWEGMTLAELAAQQQSKNVSSWEELLGGWPDHETEDGFEDSWRRWRDRN